MNQIIAETINGKIFKCSKCNAIHIEYKNLNFNFNDKDFKKFVRYIQNLDGIEWETCNANSCFRRKILLPVGSGYFYALFNNEELEEFKQLVNIEHRKKEEKYEQTIKAGNLEFISMLN